MVLPPAEPPVPPFCFLASPLRTAFARGVGEADDARFPFYPAFPLQKCKSKNRQIAVNTANPFTEISCLRIQTRPINIPP